MYPTNATRLRLLTAALVLAVATALTGLLAHSDTAHTQGTFNPTASYGVSDSTPGAAADIISSFSIPKGDLQFGGTVNFAPPEWVITPGADVPDGALVAKLSSEAVLGLINGGCNQTLAVSFDMMDATVDTSSTIPFRDPEDTNPPDPKVPDTNDKQGAEPDDQFDIGADNLPLGVTRYPDYLTRIFIDPSGNTIVPLARIYGQTEVAGIEVSLNFVLFEPGLFFKAPNGNILLANPAMGYPSITVLQAAGDPDTKPNTGDANGVSDFCSPLTANTELFKESKDNPDTTADEGGVKLRTNPTDAGTYNFTMYALSQRDADGDGYENGLDTCPLNANPEWDPRITAAAGQAGDIDGDGLGDVCDPDPNLPGAITGGAFDEDADFYGNRTDNCPLVANSLGQPGGSGPDNQEDSDSDGIGDQCDPNPDNADTEGTQLKVCVVAPIDIGGGGTPLHAAPQDMLPCDPNADADNDTLSDEDEMLTYGTDPNNADTDGDGVSDADEIAAGTDPLVAGASDAPTAGTTPTAGSTPTAGTGDVGGDVSTGIGSLAPVASSIPAWATALSALGGAGLLGSLGALAARIFGIRLPGRRH